MATTDDARLARDAAHRALALDIRQSFLVQAPAGSGKTELLIQRYLALLAVVERPERVVAMTFTRKAAGEMRERVIEALRDAAQGSVVADAHRARTRELAVAALARDCALGWSLLAHPSQLAIYTIDAWCAAIARQAPLTSGIGSAPRLEDRAQPIYRAAARAALAAAPSGDPHWSLLLAHLDNDAEQVVTLLASLLGRREQWLRHLRRREASALRGDLERVLQSEIDGELAVVHSRFGPALRDMLARCAAYAAENLRRDGVDEVLAAALAVCAAHGGLPPPAWPHLRDWRVLANWLLVQDKPRLRKGMNRYAGIPPKGSGPGAAQRDARKREIAALLERLADEVGVADALLIARSLPPPEYEDSSWAVIAALLDILPRAAAQLLVTFGEQGALDYSQLTLAALAALGMPDAPSDLLLRLDMKIEHLLIDEFQDTSDAQYELLARLTAGWTQGDGRTLFAVGDPMQSIYRFREAEVRLFLEAQALQRIGDVPVRFVDLARNFRSQAHMVAWVNEVFPTVLAASHDPWRGAVAFAAAVPAHGEGQEGRPTVDLVGTATEEADQVVARVRAALAADAGDVAILVRSRSALVSILPALRAAGIGFAAVELDPLGARQAILDLASLAHALMQPADRLATLCVLRAPWCGLTLADLLAAAEHADSGLEGLLAARDGIAGLTPEGRARMDRLAGILLPAFAEHARAPIADRVRGAWLALGGPASIDETIDFDAAEDFFALLRSHSVSGDVRDWNALVEALSASHATPAGSALARVKVMTLHKAKGLEFDTVILPGLARTQARDGVELLRWRARPHGLMLAASTARGAGDDPLYRYLAFLAAAEMDHELGRLLYVGATRAKRRLHLVATVKAAADETSGRRTWKPPRNGSALAKLWGAVAAELPDPMAHPAHADTPQAGRAPPLRRFPDSFALPALPASTKFPAAALQERVVVAPPFDWAHATAAAIGTVTHRLLAQIAREGLAAWKGVRVDALRPRIRADLVGEGVDGGQLDAAVADVAEALVRLLADGRGQWIFDPAHTEPASEWALSARIDGAIVHVSLDRSFVAGGVRWIIDFKTGRHEGGDPEAFLAREVERYRPQLERYARIVRGLDPRPIRLALYFPLVAGGWREWPSATAGDPPAPLEIR